MNLLDKNSLKIKLVSASIIVVIIPMFFATIYNIRNFLNMSEKEINYTLESEINSADIIINSYLKSFLELGKNTSQNFALVTPMQFDMEYQVIKYGDEILKNNEKINQVIIKSVLKDKFIYGEAGEYFDLIEQVERKRNNYIGIDESGQFISVEPIKNCKKELLGVLFLRYNFLEDTERILEMRSKINSDIFLTNGKDVKLWVEKNKIEKVEESIHTELKKFKGRIYKETLELKGKDYFINVKRMKNYNGDESFLYAVMKDRVEIKNMKNGILYNMILFSLIAVAAMALIIVILLNILLKPLKKLEEVAKAISNGDYSVKIKEKYNSEFANLARAFNNMTYKIGESIARIKEKETEYSSLVENLNVGVYRTLIENDGEIVKANIAAAKIFGFNFISEILGKKVIDFYENKATRDSLLAVLKSQGKIKDLAICFRKNTGEKIWCSVSASIENDSNGKAKWLNGTLEDISERRKNEEELKKYREQLELLVNERTSELSNAMKKLKNSQNKLIESEKMAALGQLIAGIAHEINTPLGAINSSIDSIIKSLETSVADYLDFICNMDYTIKKDFKEILTRAMKSERVMTTREERRIRKEIQMRLDLFEIEKSSFIADNLVDIGIYDNYEKYISTFRNENIEELLDRVYKMSGIKRNSDTIVTATNQASKVVFALKTFTHYDHIGEKVEADIIKGIETVLTLYHNKIKYDVEILRNYDEIPKIMCYPDDLNQVWTNIIHNALQAMDYKGRIKIEIKEKRKYVDISIIDNGPGIKKEIEDKIFKPFFTTKKQGEGSGLGLDIVKKIIEKHNGNITVNSEPGRTSFTVSLKIK